MPKIEIDANHCKGCGLCIDACPKKVIVFSEDINKLGYHPATPKNEGCIGCGICFYTCPEPESITVYKEDKSA
ncbi:MAG: 4Fe-4S dicluster domain-containing protein [Candidatus Coatesbacteria bacterium]|nr:4Fe-4S dicluster domain-containing protein [Candidatus Coatesbacteria bacterium]